jgi:hypothetical protein
LTQISEHKAIIPIDLESPYAQELHKVESNNTETDIALKQLKKLTNL